MQRALSVVFLLYTMSLLISMAGMETFGWLTFVLAMALSARDFRKGEKSFFGLGPDWVLLALPLIVAAGFIFNAAPDADFKGGMGYLRWIILMYGLAHAFRYTKVSERGFQIMLVVACVVGVYTLFEFFFEYDFFRRKAISPMQVGVPVRPDGFFSIATTFAHSIVMTVCFPIAALLLNWRKDNGMRALLAMAVSLLLVSLYLSQTRGAWISLIVAGGVMLAIRSRKLLLLVGVAFFVLVGSLMAARPVFRDRVVSIVDFSHPSNSERMDLWRLNLRIGQEYPLFGVGMNENERRKVELAEQLGMKVPLQGNAHNTYLQWFAGAGALGLLAYLSFILFYLVLTWRLWKVVPQTNVWHRTLILGALGAQVALHVGGLTDCNFKDAEVAHQFLFILSMLSYLRFVYLKNAV